MKSEGYTDAAFAGYNGFRYTGVFLLAIPLGLFIRQHKLRPYFITASIALPLVGICIIFSTHFHFDRSLYVLQFLWGAGYTLIQIPLFPCILRNCPEQTMTESISLGYAMYSLAGILSGLLIICFKSISEQFFTDQIVLITICVISMLGIYFSINVRLDEKIEKKNDYQWNDYDWKIIIKSITPSFILAVGAGFTVPFISLFFNRVFGMSTSHFSMVSPIAAALVVIGSLMVPKLKSKFGYRKAVPFTQSLAIIALVTMAISEYFAHWSFAVYIAVAAYLLRQPLMNMAGPMTTEVMMKYAGAKNREMVSGLNSAIWSGSFAIGSFLVQLLLHAGYTYIHIFTLTAAIYCVGVLWWYLLILDLHKRENLSTTNTHSEWNH